MLSARTGARWADTALVLSVALSAVGAGLPAVVRAASPSPPAPGGDPRSSGAGPGFVGDPLTVILVVLAIGLGTVLITSLYVRLTRPREPG